LSTVVWHCSRELQLQRVLQQHVAATLVTAVLLWHNRLLTLSLTSRVTSRAALQHACLVISSSQAAAA
jgi:hypothetical protein